MKKHAVHPLGLLLWASFLFLNASAFGQSSSDIFLYVKGAKQGVMTGSVTEKGKEGAIKVATCQNNNLSPRDAASGQASGKRQHSPVTITKQLDKSSPMLMKAFADRENLPEVSITYYKTGKSGATKSYTVTLSNALISSLISSTGDKSQTQEEVSFTFQKIEWTWYDGGAAASDGRSQSKN